MSLGDWLKSRRALQRLLIAAELRAEKAAARAEEAERRLATVARCAHGHIHVTAGQAIACAARSPEDMARIRALTEGEA